MTALTFAHTAVSLLPVGLGLAAFARHGRIDPRTRLGQLYIATMGLGSVSAFGFIASFGFTFGQVLTLLTLALLAVGTVTRHDRWRAAGTLQTLSLSASYLLLMVFATTETLKRFPREQPFAASADDPSLLPIRLVLLALFGFGVGYQLLAAKRSPVRLAA